MASNLTKQEKEIYSDLKKKKEDLIREWLEEIKKGPDDLSRVVNLLSGSKIYTNKNTGIYPIIIKWCIINIKDFDFTDVPNYQNILSMMDSNIGAAATSATAAASGVAKGRTVSPEVDIISILKAWKETPDIDPNTNVLLSVSIRDGSAYVELYKDCINKLVKHILKNKKGSSKILTIEDCKYIKESMPTIHAVAEIKDANNNIIDTIFYDHLFVKYFLRLKGTGKHINDNVYNYDVNYTDVDYTNDLQIYLYLIVYDTFEGHFKKDRSATPALYNTFNTTEKILTSKYLSFIDSQYSLGYFVEKMCADVKNVLYMHESKITTEKINTAIFNKEVLKYMLSIAKLSLSNVDIRNQLTQNYTHLYYDRQNGYNTLKRDLYAINTNRRHPLNNIYYIYKQVIEHIAKDNNICKTLLKVYDDILKLYSDSNMKNTIYKPIKDPYNTNKGVEPQIPRRVQLPIDLQRYKMLTAAPSAAKNSEKERLLKEYDEKWKKQLNEYEKKKDIYDRIYEGKVSSNKKKWNGEHLSGRKHHKSVSPPSASFVKYSKRYKAFTTSPNNHKSTSSLAKDYYVNDSDPYTQELFEDMHPNKRKYLSDIEYIAENGKVFHYRFDTVSIYNYLLDCIRDCVQPINFINKTELTNNNLNEICNKIKYFTNKPTYNSYLDIRAILNNCVYNNKLVLNYSTAFLPYRTDNPIIGYFKIYLNLKLGGILFHVINKLPPDVQVSDNFPNQTNTINSEVAILPLFVDYLRELYFDDLTYDFPEYILIDLQNKLSKGGLISDKYYPNRKNNKDGQLWKKIIQIPEFDLDLEDEGDVAFAKLKKYREKISLL